MNDFTKKDIKNGAIVELRNGQRFLKVDNTLLNLTMDGDFIYLSSYDKKLCHKKYGFLDIMKILNPNKNRFFFENSCSEALFTLKNCGNIDWTWEREE